MPMKTKATKLLGAASDLPAPVSADTAETVPALPRFTLTTLAELGPSLPVGMPPSDPSMPRVRSFRIRPFKMKQEKALAELRDKAKGNGGKFVADVMSIMFQTVGPHNFDAMKMQERFLVINQMTMPDVLYMYLYMRYEALGKSEDVAMTVRCPACKSEFTWYGDLGTLEVRVAPDEMKTLTRTYELRDEFMLRGKPVKKVTLGYIKWDMMGRRDIIGSGSEQNATLLSSIVGTDSYDGPAGAFQLMDGDLDDMSRYDVAGIIDDIEQNTPGPQLDIEPECPQCKHQWKMMLDWRWENFFKRSVRH